MAFEKVNERWEVGVGISDGQFQQVSFVNGICTVGPWGCMLVCVYVSARSVTLNFLCDVGVMPDTTTCIHLRGHTSTSTNYT